MKSSKSITSWSQRNHGQDGGNIIQNDKMKTSESLDPSKAARKKHKSVARKAKKKYRAKAKHFFCFVCGVRIFFSKRRVDRKFQQLDCNDKLHVCKPEDVKQFAIDNPSAAKIRNAHIQRKLDKKQAKKSARVKADAIRATKNAAKKAIRMEKYEALLKQQAEAKAIKKKKHGDLLKQQAEAKAIRVAEHEVMPKQQGKYKDRVIKIVRKKTYVVPQ